MKQDHFLFRVRRRTVGVLATLFFRQVAVLAIQARLYRLGERFEVMYVAQGKSAEQNARMTSQLFFHQRAVVLDPCHQVQTRVSGLHQ